MDNFIVSARKYRPASFDMVVGQDTITQTLKNAIANNHLAQAYLFCGPRGVGKTTCARIFAKTINCVNLDATTEACDKCESCISFNTSRSFNIHELDAASNNKVEDIRSLNDQVRIPPQIGKYSIYIIDEVHMLSTNAFNAFLKTLEEPPAHAIFILATTEKHKIIPTILSRCQIFDFNRIRIDDMVKRLEYVASSESVSAEEDALHIIAQKADGAMRDALSIFDQLVSLCGKNITYSDVIENLNVLDYEYYFRITDAILKGDVSTALITFNEIINKGFDGYNFLLGLNSHFRDLLISMDNSTIHLLETTKNIEERYLKQSSKCSISFIYKALDIGSQYDISFKVSKNPRLHIELSLIKLCSLISAQDKETTYEKKKSYSGGTNKIKGEIENNGIKSVPSTGSRADKIVISSGTPVSGIGKIPEKRRSLSIKDAINKPSQAEQKGSQADPPIKEFNPSSSEIKTMDEDFLANIWNNFAKSVMDDGPRTTSMFKSISPKWDNNSRSILIYMDNTDQKELFDRSYKQRLNTYIRGESGILDITIITEVDTKEKKDIIYSDGQKLNYFQEKYPNIDDYIKTFRLTT